MEGLLITAALSLLVANLFDLSSVSMMGSAGFLLVFAAVNVANVRRARRLYEPGCGPMSSTRGRPSWSTAPGKDVRISPNTRAASPSRPVR